MTSSHDQQRRTLSLLSQTPAWHRLCALREDVDLETAAAILDGAGRLSDEILRPLDVIADREGCRFIDGRVRVPSAYRSAFRAFAEGGWIGLDLPMEYGGSGLPAVFQAAALQIFDRGCPAFNMMHGASRAGAVLLSEHAPQEVAQAWIPGLISGTRAATICMSEPDAGSDVGRIRTKAVFSDGGWRITGQKIWISFGDHDLTPVIGHCLLARTSDKPGTRGLSLFLVPSVWEDGSPNGVTPLRIEEKMGLHGSPTCALAFSGAEGILLGQLDRGLPALFAMIECMRLLTGCQGLGIASRAVDIAERYASERLQGGRPDAPPVPIISHPDVERQLGVMRGKTEVLRAAILELACTIDISRIAPESEARQASAYASFLLPLVKNFGAEIGFGVADQGIQVLGGAGYTRDWPLEQSVRDARVLSIYEGTTGMQALDFLERRLIGERAGFDIFLKRAEDVQGDLAAVVSQFRRCAEMLRNCNDFKKRARAAYDWLQAGWLALTAVLRKPLSIADPGAESYAMSQIEQRMAVHIEAIIEVLSR